MKTGSAWYLPADHEALIYGIGLVPDAAHDVAKDRGTLELLLNSYVAWRAPLSALMERYRAFERFDRHFGLRPLAAVADELARRIQEGEASEALEATRVYLDAVRMEYAKIFGEIAAGPTPLPLHIRAGSRLELRASARVCGFGGEAWATDYDPKQVFTVELVGLFKEP